MCYIYVVLLANEMNTDNSFKISKMTDYAKVVRTANGGPSGRKMKGHVANSQKFSAVSTKITANLRLDK